MKEIEIPEGYEARIEGNKIIIELKESEDERIQQSLIGFIKLRLAKQEEYFDTGITNKAVLAWLEKQKEQKPVEKPSKEEYVKKFKALCDAYEIKLPNREYDIYHLCDDLSKLSVDSGKQKPAEWSEEDERMLSRCIKSVECSKQFADSESYKAAKDVEMNWLKSLLQRFNLQPKQEWSKEHLSIIDYLIDLVDEHYKEPCTKGLLANGAQCFLRNLKSNFIQLEQKWSEEDEQYLLVCKNALNKYQRSDHWDANIISKWLENRLKSLRPHPHWKPSEEQMEWLESAVRLSTNKPRIHGIIISLYEQLKRL